MQNALRAAREEEDKVDEEPGRAGVGQGQAGKRETQGSLRPTPTTGAQHLRRGAYKVRGTGTLAECSKGCAREEEDEVDDEPGRRAKTGGDKQEKRHADQPARPPSKREPETPTPKPQLQARNT